MYKSTPLVSVIMPAFNAEKYIYNSINSVLNQSYQNWELIVVNDGSTDNTSEIVKQFNDHRIKLFVQLNGGVAMARNTGIDNSLGDYIAFLDSDDLWLKDKLKIQVDFMINHKEIDLSYTDYFSFINTNTIIENKQLFPFKIESLSERLLVFNFMATLTVMVKSSTLKSLRGFDNFLFGPEDWELWIRISKIGKIKYINEKLSMYREHQGGISKNKIRQIENEYKVINMHVLNYEKTYIKNAALWFYYLKLSSYYNSKNDFIHFIIFYIKMIKIFPFKKENYTYPIKRLFGI